MARKSAERITYRVQVLERAVDILLALSEDSRELAAGEVAERLSPHKSTVHRLLTALDHHRLIRRTADTGRYALWLRLFEFGTRARRGLQPRERAQPPKISSRARPARPRISASSTTRKWSRWRTLTGHARRACRTQSAGAHPCVWFGGGEGKTRLPARIGGR